MSASGRAPASLAVPPAVAQYGDIIFRDRPVHDGDLFSRRHPRMSQLNRAKLFAPFAALAGFDERVRHKEIAYVPRHELDAEEEWALNRRLCALERRTGRTVALQAGRPRAVIEYFVPCDDVESDFYLVKGQYKTIVGTVLRVDRCEQRLTVQSEAKEFEIPFAEIYRITDPPK